MSKLMIALFAATGLGLAGAATAQGMLPTSNPTPMSKATYTQATKDADAQYKRDKAACAPLSGNARDICVAEAKGKDNIAKAVAEAAYKQTPKARETARIAHAQASYGVAIEKCDDQAGNRKDACVKEAKAELIKGKANAKVDRVAADASQDATAKTAEARKEAAADKSDAGYRVAIEKCDALSGAAKDACVPSAKAQFVNAQSPRGLPFVGTAVHRCDGASAQPEAIGHHPSPSSPTPLNCASSRHDQRHVAAPWRSFVNASCKMGATQVDFHRRSQFVTPRFRTAHRPWRSGPWQELPRT